MKRVSVKFNKRNLGKKSEIRNMRKKGYIPVEIYGKGVPNTHAFISYKDLKSMPHGELFLIEADLDGEKKICLLKEIQYGYLGDNPIHIDLYDISNVEETNVEVPIEFIGNPKGVELGGTFEVHMHSLEIKVNPRNIPEKIIVDVSNLGLGEVLHVRDIQIPEGSKLVENPDEVVAVVVEPEIEEEASQEEAQG